MQQEDMAVPDNRESPVARVRAAKACERCHRKRVKCDVIATGQPCSRCRKNGTVECNLLVSRRGRYSRDVIKQRAALAREAAANGEDALALVNGGRHEVNESPSVPGHHEGPCTDDYTSPDSVTTTGKPSYREISWSNMFSHFLDSRNSTSRDAIDKCSITYLGESFPLALVLNDIQDGSNSQQLHHPGPPHEDDGVSTNLIPERSHPSHLLPEDMNCLLSKKAFEYPDRQTFDALISTFLDTVYPLYPVVNRQEFVQQYEQDRLPWLLLQASCFAAATFCPESILHRAGYASRRQARFSFYRKAKALFDTGYESNKIVILQSVIMLTYWGGSPNNYWNFYSWVSTGVTIAETLGIHRSLRGTNMARKDTALLRRLWWTLMIRDAFCASLVGRPFRINTDMGDAEMLTMDDFDDDVLTAEHPLKGLYGMYQIEMAKLSLILRQIVYTRWLPGRMRDSSNILNDSIHGWRQGLHPSLDWNRSHNMLSTVLSIVYDHHIILATLGSQRLSDDGAQPAVDLATQRLSAAASSVVVKSQTLQVPHEVFHCIFTAGVACYEQIRNPQPTVAQLGRSTLNNCQMVLQAALNNWDASSWVMDLFEKLSSSLPRATINVDLQRRDTNETSGMEWIDFDAAMTMELGVGSPWQSNPMLSALFDFPTEFGTLDHALNTQTDVSGIPV